MCPNSPPNLEIVWNNNKMQKMIEKVSIKSKNTVSMVFFYYLLWQSINFELVNSE
jgi:hypothetical protein